MVKNLPAKAGDTGSSPGPGRSQKIPHAAEQLSLRATTTEARAPKACAPQQEKPPQWEACSPQLEKARTQQQRPNTAKNKYIF